MKQKSIVNCSVKHINSEMDGPKISARPKSTLRLSSARPMSARPAAPRIRDRGEVIVTEEIR